MERFILRQLIICLLFTSVCSAELVDILYNTASQCAPVVVTNNNDELQSAVAASSVTIAVKEGVTAAWVDLTLSDACTNAANTWCQEDEIKAKGVYRVCFATTSIDTKGRLYYTVRGTSIKTRYFVAPVETFAANINNDKFPSSGTIPNTTTPMLVSDGTGAGQIDTLSGSIVNVDLADTCTLVTNAVTLPTIPADWITAAGIATGAITVSEAPNLDATVSTRSTFNATTDAVDLDFTLACPVTPTAGTVGDACKTSADSTAQTGDIYPLASTEIADIKAKTDLIPADPADASDIAALLSPIQADTNDMQTRLPAVLVGGKMDSDMTAISGDTVAADNLEAEHDGTGYMGSGIAVSPTTDADTSGNLWRTIEIVETGIITANDDHIGKYLWCGKEFSEIMKTVQGVTDTITVDPAEPFGTAQTSGTCYVK